jgi:hypothetical protein
MRALIDELERDDADDYWSSGCARAQVVGVDERAAIGMLALAAAWESSGATAGALGVACTSARPSASDRVPATGTPTITVQRNRVLASVVELPLRNR